MAGNQTSGKAREAKAKRQEEATTRNAVYAALPLDEKLKRAVPGSKQHKRLLTKASASG